MPVFCLCTVPVKWVYPRVSVPASVRVFCPRLLFLFVVFAQWACLVSLFKYCWSTNEALVMFLIGHYLLLHSFESSLSFLWLQLCDSLLSLAEFRTTAWMSWCDLDAMEDHHARIPLSHSAPPLVSIIPQCHPSRKVLHFIWWWRHVEIPSISSEYFCMTSRTWRHVIFVFHFRFLMISFSDKAKNHADSRNLIFATFFDFKFKSQKLFFYHWTWSLSKLINFFWSYVRYSLNFHSSLKLLCISELAFYLWNIVR